MLILANITKEQEAGTETVGASSIAKELGIARDYTLQVLHRLKDGGILNSSRGPRGGYSLARPAEEISMGEIMQAAEGTTFEVICETKPLDLDCCSPNTSCGLRLVWYDLREHIDSFLNNKSLRELTDAIYADNDSLVFLRQGKQQTESDSPVEENTSVDSTEDKEPNSTELNQ